MLKLSTDKLKLIAALTMLIDHIGEMLLLPLYGYQSNIYIISRLIGRISFPIFAFFIAIGFKRSQNIKAYILRMLIFAIISEPIFNLCFYEKPFYFGLHNVLFTFVLALTALFLYTSFLSYAKNNFKTGKNLKYIISLISVVIFLLFCLISYFLECDYSYIGILLIGIFYIYPNNLISNILILFCMFYNTPSAILSGFLISRHKDEEYKKQNILTKYFFYCFYPAHLLILLLIKLYLFK